jgi:hypothetical protein
LRKTVVTSKPVAVHVGVTSQEAMLLACVTILLYPIQISKLSVMILTICRVISICLYWGPFQTIYNHLVNYQATSGHHNFALALYVLSCPH